jgi:acyl dehydratase
MPLSTASIGHSTEPFEHDVDARWLMAYAAGIGDLNPRYLDTLERHVVAHPVFPVCLEWPVILASRDLPGYDLVTPAERARGVHAAHDLHIFRPIRAGERLTTRGTHIGLKRIKPGAAQMTRLDTVDAAGTLVCRTYQLSISRGVDIVGTDTEIETPPAWPMPPADAADAARGADSRVEIPVAAGAAHVYTECARIWNPIHTDRAVAVGAGLPDIILHGTATMALAVTRLVDGFLGGDPTRVRRLGGRFTAMVLMPSTLVLEVRAATDGVMFFRVLTESGDEAFSNGFLRYD